MLMRSVMLPAMHVLGDSIGPTKIGSSHESHPHHHDHGSSCALFIKGMNHFAYGSMEAQQKEEQPVQIWCLGSTVSCHGL